MSPGVSTGPPKGVAGASEVKERLAFVGLAIFAVRTRQREDIQDRGSQFRLII